MSVVGEMVGQTNAQLSRARLISILRALASLTLNSATNGRYQWLVMIIGLSDMSPRRMQ